MRGGREGTGGRKGGDLKQGVRGSGRGDREEEEKREIERGEVTARLTILNKRINLSDSHNVSQHVTQPLRVNEIEVT